MNWTKKVGAVKKWAIPVLAASLLLVSASCNRTGTPKLARIEITQDSAGKLEKGSTVQLAATCTFSDGSTQAVTSKVTWTSSDTKVATVSPYGVASGLKVGIANISASWRGVVSTPFPLEVTGLASIAISPDAPVSMAVGTSMQLQLDGLTSDGSPVAVGTAQAWSSSDTKIATVSSTGVVTAVGPGKTDISASSQGMTSQAVFITVLPFSSVVVTPESPGSLAARSGLQFKATAIYPDGTSADVTSQAVWRTSDPGIASFTSPGRVLGVAAGLVVIQATWQGIFSSPVSLIIVASPSLSGN